MTDTEVFWQAVRDRHYVPGPVYAVHSTGVYCRSDCPSRRPTRAQVSFFESPDEAEGEGFRPCKRCRPQDAAQEEKDLAALVQALEAALEGGVQAPNLTSLAAAVSLEPSYAQRLFKRRFGLSPKAYLEARRAERFRVKVKEGLNVTEALYGAGYGSSRALYERSDALLGMTPSAYRKGGEGMRVRYTVFESALGSTLLAATERGVCALRFGEGRVELEAEFPKAELVAGSEGLEPYMGAVHAYLAGERVLELPLDLSPTAFQAKVWSALQKVPYGETRSYAEVAEAIGDRAAVRAVASACARNPVALAVPCHRVVRSDGSLSGYRWGVERKAKLLEREKGRAGSVG